MLLSFAPSSVAFGFEPRIWNKIGRWSQQATVRQVDDAYFGHDQAVSLPARQVDGEDQGYLRLSKQDSFEKPQDASRNHSRHIKHMLDGLEPHAHLKAHVDLSSAQISLAIRSTATSQRESTHCFFGCQHQKAKLRQTQPACEPHNSISVTSTCF